MADYQYPLRELDDGAIIGAASTSKLAFYGTTPCDQPAAPAAAVTAGSTTTVCNTAVAEIQAALQELGLMDT